MKAFFAVLPKRRRIILPPDAVSYYTLDELSGDAIDSISGFNGVPNNASIYNGAGDSIKGNHFQFTTAQSTFVALPNTYNFIQNTNNFTINLWVKAISGATRDGLIGNAISTVEKGFFFLFDNFQAQNAVNRLRFVSFRGVQNASTMSISSQNNVITDLEWHMVTVVGLGNTGKMYLDGVEVPLLINDFDILSTGAGLNAMSLGAVRRDTVFANNFLDEVSIFSRGLDATEITNLYNQYI